MSPFVQGLILGLLTAGLGLAVVTSLWLTSTNKTTTTQISAG